MAASKITSRAHSAELHENRTSWVQGRGPCPPPRAHSGVVDLSAPPPVPPRRVVPGATSPRRPGSLAPRLLGTRRRRAGPHPRRTEMRFPSRSRAAPTPRVGRREPGENRTWRCEHEGFAMDDYYLPWIRHQLHTTGISQDFNVLTLVDLGRRPGRGSTLRRTPPLFVYRPLPDWRTGARALAPPSCCRGVTG